MKKIKLLVVTDEMEVGGTQRQISYILKYIDKQKFSVTLLYFRNDSFLVDELISAGIKVVQIEKTKRVDFSFFLNFYKFLKKEQFDIIHCFSFTGEFWGAVVNLFSKEEVLISSVRGIYEWYSPVQWRLKKWVSNRSAYVIANSLAGAKYATKMTGLANHKMKVIYNGIPELEFKSKKSARKSLTLPSQNRIGLFVGRLIDEKNVASIIEALNIIALKKSDFKFYIVGDGPERDNLKALVSSTLQKNIEFLGERNDVITLLSAADFVILSSLREGLSNTILESMLAAKPVIASKVGGNPELVDDGITGYLYPSGDVPKLAELIDHVLSTNDSILDTLGRNARTKILDNFSIDTMVEKFETLYQSCIDEKNNDRIVK